MTHSHTGTPAALRPSETEVLTALVRNPTLKQSLIKLMQRLDMTIHDKAKAAADWIQQVTVTTIQDYSSYHSYAYIDGSLAIRERVGIHVGKLAVGHLL